MTFPVIESTSQYGGAWQSIQEHAFTLPSGVESGDILLVLVKTNDNATVTIDGFAEVAHHKFSRVANGSEGSSVTVVSTIAHRASIVGYRISGADVSQAVLVEESNPSSSSPQVTAPWGTRDNLFVAALQTDAGDQSVGPPSNYGNLLTSGDTHPATTRNRIWSAHRQLASASDTPGAWTLNSGTLESERAYTFVVAGPGGGEPDPPPSDLAGEQTPAITLTWDDTLGGPYDLRRNETIIASGLTDPTYTDTDVTVDTSYDYEVRSDGGTWSDPVTVNVTEAGVLPRRIRFNGQWWPSP